MAQATVQLSVPRVYTHANTHTQIHTHTHTHTHTQPSSHRCFNTPLNTRAARRCIHHAWKKKESKPITEHATWFEYQPRHTCPITIPPRSIYIIYIYTHTHTHTHTHTYLPTVRGLRNLRLPRFLGLDECRDLPGEMTSLYAQTMHPQILGFHGMYII